MTRTCKHCGRTFEPTDMRHEYCGPTCRANHHYEAHPEKGRRTPPVPLRSVATHPLVEVRELQEQQKEKARWTPDVRRNTQPARLFDPTEARERPLSAFRDAESEWAA